MCDTLREITDESFVRDVLEKQGLFLVDFWASWCAPCRMLAPTLVELQKFFTDRLTIFKMNTDTELKRAAEYSVQGLPCLLLFKNGNLKATLVGNQPKLKLIDWIETNL